MTTVILHLSDIHIRSDRDWIIDKADAIASAVIPALPEASAVFIVVSGDIAWSGKSDEYRAATKLLDGIRNRLSEEGSAPVHFVVAPGNHDCDFSQNNKTRLLTLTSVRSTPAEIDESVIETGCSIQAPYRAFAEALHSAHESRIGDKLWCAHRFTVEGKEIVFDVLNVSWCSQIHEEPGSLVFPHERYSQLLEETTDLRIGVIHHPLNWFSQAMYHPFKQLLRSLSNVIISGHEHVGGVGEDLNAASGHSAYVDGCILQDEQRPTSSSFNVVELNLDEGAYRSTRYLWNIDGRHYSATEEAPGETSAVSQRRV
ncbi:MAG: metallophosphoesterase [Rhodoferax sp.]|nr:metallophosphoesterase [Rhodoferax sp.]